MPVEKEAATAPTAMAQGYDKLMGVYHAVRPASTASWLTQVEIVLAALVVNLQTAVHLSRADRQMGWTCLETLLERYIIEKHRGRR